MHPKSKRCRRIYKPSFWGLSYLCVFCPWLPDVQEFVVNDAVPVFFLGAILGRCITFFRGSPIEPPRVQHEKLFLDNPRKAHDVYQEWLEEKNIIRLFTPFQALPPPFRKKKKTEKPPLPCSVGPGKFVLNGAGFNIFSQVPLGLNLWLPRGGIGGPGIPLLRQRQWPLTAFRVVRIICNKGKEQKLVDIDKYEFCSEIAYSSQEDSEWGGISMDAQWHDVPNPADLWIN